MPAPKAVLIDIEEFGLSHEHDHRSIRANGRLSSTSSETAKVTEETKMSTEVTLLEEKNDVMTVTVEDSTEASSLSIDETDAKDTTEKKNRKGKNKSNQ